MAQATTLAEHTVQALANDLHDYFGYGTFTVYEPDFHCSGWAIACEDGPYYWTLGITEVLRDLGFQPYAEPVNDWCLGIYDC